MRHSRVTTNRKPNTPYHPRWSKPWPEGERGKSYSVDVRQVDVIWAVLPTSRRGHRMRQGRGWAVAVAVAILGCGGSTADTNAGPAPQVIGVAVAGPAWLGWWAPATLLPDPNWVPPYPQPDPTWAATNFPGICPTMNAANQCSPQYLPPRAGPAFAPFHFALSSSDRNYPCIVVTGNTTCSGGRYVAAVPADGKYSLLGVPADVINSDPTHYLPITIQFNTLLDPSSVQATPAVCSAAAGVRIYVTSAGDPTNGPDRTSDFEVCLGPLSSETDWGNSMTIRPLSGNLSAGTKYRVLAFVKDQRGTTVPVDLTITTAP